MCIIRDRSNNKNEILFNFYAGYTCCTYFFPNTPDENEVP